MLGLIPSKKLDKKSQELLQMLQGGDSEVNWAIKIIIKHNFPRVNKFILSNKGSKDEAEEIIQQNLLKLVEKARDGKLGSIKDIHAYFYIMCKNHWLNRQRGIHRFSSLSQEMEENLSDKSIDPHRIMENKDIALAVEQMLDHLGNNCKKLLIWSLGEGLDMKSVAKALNYENANTAMNIKSRCKKKLKELINQNQGYQQLVSQVIFS